MTPFQAKLARLDMALTGSTTDQANHTVRENKVDPDNMAWGRVCYLSDGGYTRVFFGHGAMELVLTSTGASHLERVLRWGNDDVVALRRDIEKDILALFE